MLIATQIGGFVGAGLAGVAYAARYKDTSCPIHPPRQPTASTELQAAHVRGTT